MTPRPLSMLMALYTLWEERAIKDEVKDESHNLVKVSKYIRLDPKSFTRPSCRR